MVALHARASGEDVALPVYQESDVTVKRSDWTPVDSVQQADIQQQLRALPVGGVGPILTSQDRWYFIRVLGRR